MSMTVISNRWLKGLKEAAISGFSSFVFGELIAAILSLTQPGSTLTVAFPIIATLGGTGFGFLHGSEA